MSAYRTKRCEIADPCFCRGGLTGRLELVDPVRSRYVRDAPNVGFPDELDRSLTVDNRPPIQPFDGGHKRLSPQRRTHEDGVNQLVRPELRSNSEEDRPPLAVFTFDHVQVSGVLDMRMVAVKDDRVDMSRRCDPRTEGFVTPINPFLVAVLRTSLGSEEVVPPVTLDNVTTLCRTQHRVHSQTRRREGTAGLEVEFVRVGDDLHGELWLVGHMKSSAGEVSPIVVVEQDLREYTRRESYHDQMNALTKKNDLLTRFRQKLETRGRGRRTTHILIETQLFKVHSIAPFGIVVDIIGAHVEPGRFYHVRLVALRNVTPAMHKTTRHDMIHRLVSLPVEDTYEVDLG